MRKILKPKQYLAKVTMTNIRFFFCNFEITASMPLSHSKLLLLS